MVDSVAKVMHLTQNALSFGAAVMPDIKNVFN